MVEKSSIPRQKRKCLNILRTVILSLGGWQFGYYVVCMNVLTKPIITGVFGYNEHNTDASTLTTISGMVNFVFAMGALIGTFFTGELAGRFGRRTMLYVGDILALITILPLSIDHIGSFFVGRFLSGMVAGINISIYSVWLFELLPNKLCGIGGISGYFFVTLGKLFSYLSQNIWEYQELVDYWRVFLLYPIGVALIRLSFYPFLFKTETPKYLYEKANPITSKNSKTQIHPKPTSPPENTKLTQETAAHSSPSTPHDEPLVTLVAETERGLNKETAGVTDPESENFRASHVKGYDSIKDAYSHIYHKDDVEIVALEHVKHWEKQREEGITKVNFHELFTKKYRKQLIMGCFISIAQQLSGINFFSFYSTVLFNSISGNGKLITLVFGVVNLGGNFFSVITTCTLGRKPNLIVGSFGEAVGWVLFIIGFKLMNVPLLIVSVVVFTLFYSIGLGGSQALYISEVLPPIGVGFALAVQWAFIGITGLTFPFLIEAVGPVAMSVFFLIYSVFAGVYIWFTAVETRNKSPKTIFDEFNRSFFQICNKKTSKNTS